MDAYQYREEDKMKSLGFLLLVIMLPFTAHAALVLDNCETGNNTNTLGGSWQTYVDTTGSISFTANSEPGYNNSHYCRKFNAKVVDTAGWAGAETGFNAGWTAQDLSAYAGLRFYARGSGLYNILLPMEGTRTTYNHYACAITLTSEWQLFELPFSRFAQTWGTPVTWNQATIYSVQINAAWATNTTWEMYVDDIEFYKAGEEKSKSGTNIIGTPKANQAGYLTHQKKFFTVASDTAGAGATYTIRNNTTSNEIVYTGAIGNTVFNETAASEQVVTGDFSAFVQPGKYKIEVNGKYSHPFVIADDAYNQTFKDMLRVISLIRCGTAVNDVVTGLAHPVCHMADGNYDDKAGSRDLTGGWHNAGDFGKWVPMTSLAVAHMLWLYEQKTATMQNVNLNIPESGNNLPDLLDEAKWGLSWLLKMQNADGSVYHKVDTEPDFAFGLTPDKDPYTRTAKPQGKGSTQFSTVDAADLCAIMAQASRVYSKLDSAFATRCADAAQKAWAWIEANPKTGQADQYYIDNNYTEELIWAEGEMFRLTGSTKYTTLFEGDIDKCPLAGAYYNRSDIFGYLSLYFDPQTPAALKTKIKTKVTDLANSYLPIADNSGYGVALSSADYSWGSNYFVAGKANVLIFAYLMSFDQKYLDYALRQVNYLLGVNALDLSFLSKEGENSVKRPYHWTAAAYQLIIPGLMVGGPNQYKTGADSALLDLINQGTPPAKCYVDQCSNVGSWASNECGLDNCWFMFTLGYFYNQPDKKPGDVNNDNQVNIIDALLIARYCASLAPQPDPGAADVNKDGAININDALLVARYAAGLIQSF